MSRNDLHFVVPGSLDQRTGGYVYDARMIRGLRDRGRSVRVHELEGAFPEADGTARRSLADTLESVPSESVVIVDGLAGGGLPEVLATHRERLRTVALVHHPLADETGLPASAAARLQDSERSALAACRGVVVTSSFTARRLEEYEVPPDRIRVAVPGTEPGATASGPGAGKPAQLVCVASITPRKGHRTLVDALARIRDLEWSCVLAGSGRLAPDHARRVRDHVEDNGLAGRVSFVGELGPEALDELYRRSTLFVLASHYEGYGMALTEALARGLPVVSTTGGAIPFTVPEDAGVLVPPGDASALGRALRSVLAEDGEMLRRLKAGAIRAAGTLPDWAQAVVAFEGAVDTLARLDPGFRRVSANSGSRTT
ncbi:MAG: glycosyltransferase family 4 protein [Gemmatimonadota bacterium]|nr:glycosyltransferase family 4 protein [Gemmatimonadota bacterium]